MYIIRGLGLHWHRGRGDWANSTTGRVSSVNLGVKKPRVVQWSLMPNQGPLKDPYDSTMVP